MAELSSNNTNSGALETLDLLNAPEAELPAETIKEPEKPIKEPEVKEPEEETETEDDEPSEDKEPELNLSEEEDEFTYTATPAVAELKKTFPDLFKKYPALEKTIRRESHYAEVFPTIQEARDAASQIAEYKQVESELNSGSIGNLLGNLKKSNGKAFDKVADGILESIKTLDQDAFYAITQQNVANVLGNAFNKFKSADKDSSDYQVALAAQILHKYISGDTEIGKITRKETVVNPKEEELTKKEQEFETRRFNAAANEVNSRVKQIAQNSIEKAIDPRDVMTPFAKNAAIKQCMDELIEEIQTDSRFNKLLISGWTQARSEDYSDASKAKIRKMLLSKSQNVLPAIIQRIRNEAVKGSRKMKTSDESSDEKPLSRGRPAGSTNRTSNSNGKDKAIPANMSTRDYLMQD